MASVPEDKPVGSSAIERRRAADHESFLTHARMRWLWAALALSGIAMAAYLAFDFTPRPNGGTWYGYAMGTVGAALIVWLSLLGIRKRRITAGAWSLKGWTSAHVYLGLALAVVGTLHTGFQFGWNVHTLAYALMMMVIVSGIYGVAVYATLPRALSDNRKQMTSEMMLEALGGIDRQLRSAAQPLDRADADRVLAALDQDPFGFGMIARLSNRYPHCATRRALRAFAGDQGADSARARVHALLDRRIAQLGQMRRYMRLKALLEVWLYVHVPVTIALLAALTAHIVSVFYYW